jgi:succinate dehydrogenase / fumarate reductase cytochrome b subunit
MAQPERPLSPFMHYRWQYTNTLSILHRVTGVLLSACFFLLVYWLAAAAAGPETYAGAQRCLGSPLIQPVLFGGLLAFCYHLLNGVRHLFFDAGVGFELATARRSGWAVGIGAIVLTLVAWLVLRTCLGGVA